ncbi:MAG: M48 family metalloprotease [Planctomycetota bacterium]|nr:M48 family metalloprotease [Planctomycetota bacterium]
MGPSTSFLLGLAILAAHGEWSDRLPGEDAPRLWFLWALIFVPWLLSRATTSRAQQLLSDQSSLISCLRFRLRLQTLSVPIAYAAIIAWGGIPDLGPSAWATVQFAILVSPLVFMEVSLRLGEESMARTLEAQGLPAPASVGRRRVPMMLFILLLVFVATAATDLLALIRSLHVFVEATSLGSLLGLLALSVAFCLILPLALRLVFPVSARLPAHLEQDLHNTVTRLGFPRRGLLSMQTDYRVINAALVGPLPWPRYLILSDGLLALLNPMEIRGVVAHEVAHARAHHPALLLVAFVLLPLLLISPALSLGVAEMSARNLIVAGAVASLVALLLLRGLSHRFEYEADQLAADSLGGAAAGAQALQRVGRAVSQGKHRSFLRHPSEHDRIEHLSRCASDKGFRTMFYRRGRRLRAFLGITVIAALGACAWGQARQWSFDRAVYLHYTGCFPQAKRQLEALESESSPVPDDLVMDLREENRAALELFPDGGRWSEICDDLAARSWLRGCAELSSSGARAARPWLALSVSADGVDPLHRCVYRYCQAAIEGDTAEQDRIRSHLQHRFTLPVTLSALFR